MLQHPRLIKVTFNEKDQARRRTRAWSLLRSRDTPSTQLFPDLSDRMDLPPPLEILRSLALTLKN